MNKLLLLEDNAERITAFRAALAELGGDWTMQLWHDAPTMLAECENCFEGVTLISLDHDLNPQPGVTADPGTGLEVAKFLAGWLPFCPVIIHSSNTDRAWSMHNELRFAGWQVDRVGPLNDDWIPKFWLPKAREMLAAAKKPAASQKPADHLARLQRAFISLEGLAVGDGLGQLLMFSYPDTSRILRSGLPAGPWSYTDDTEMALSIVEVMKHYGHVQQDALARRFAWRYELAPSRGYGKLTRSQMRQLLKGGDWRQTTASPFEGQGSMGNGGAMRVAPLGAYFADDLERVVVEARASSLVTHSHPEGVAGTIAVAVAAAMAWQLRAEPPADRARRFLEEVLRLTPESKVRQGIVLAAQISPTTPVAPAAKSLGNGSQVTAPDTVPFTLWCAAHNLDDYAKALTLTISGGGDCDTTAAIVGGIVATATGLNGIPQKWRDSKEPLPFVASPN